MITTLTLTLIAGMLMAIYWPPFLLMYVRREDYLWYDQRLVKRIMLAPRWWLAVMLHVIFLTLLAIAAVLYLVDMDGTMVPGDDDAALVVLFAVNVTIVHFFVRAVTYNQSAVGAIITAALAMMTAMAMTALAAVVGAWISFGLLVVYVIYTALMAGMAINWILCGPVPNECAALSKCEAKHECVTPCTGSGFAPFLMNAQPQQPAQFYPR